MRKSLPIVLTAILIASLGLTAFGQSNGAAEFQRDGCSRSASPAAGAELCVSRHGRLP